MANLKVFMTKSKERSEIQKQKGLHIF